MLKTSDTDIGRRTAESPVRLLLRDRDTAPGPIDGAWWPRTLRPVDEMHEVVSAVAPRIGRLVRLVFDWRGAETGSTAPNARIMHLEGSNGARLALLVVPAGTAPESARSQMRWAIGLPLILDTPAEPGQFSPV
ncbi:DUF5994 family protein [Nocardia thailandica]|uniref:DUF5994 family protein n=1 Tax=Nocardia thailandica TaxID=257275 RepID=A0ABW6PGX7_9NOCA|nr:DUF5994 family protein [Nocardia thailandica]